MLPVRVSRTALPAFRRSMQRRLQSNVGTQNNTFNKERQAVKDHAAATSGSCHRPEGVEYLCANIMTL